MNKFTVKYKTFSSSVFCNYCVYYDPALIKFVLNRLTLLWCKMILECVRHNQFVVNIVWQHIYLYYSSLLAPDLLCYQNAHKDKRTEGTQPS